MYGLQTHKYLLYDSLYKKFADPCDTRYDIYFFITVNIYMCVSIYIYIISHIYGTAFIWISIPIIPVLQYEFLND